MPLVRPQTRAIVSMPILHRPAWLASDFSPTHLRMRHHLRSRNISIHDPLDLRRAGYLDKAMAAAGLVKPIVLISGFWRSGTTWVQECIASAVGAKTVFEPLSPKIPARKKALEATGLHGDALLECAIPSSLNEDDAVWTYLDRAFNAVDTDVFGLTCRRSVRESLRHAIVVKCVRLQFNLTQVHLRYGLPVIHIQRRPVDAVTSLLRAHWYWTLNDVSLAEIFPERGAELAPFDLNAVSRASAIWAITEREAFRSLAGQAWAKVVQYENMLVAPQETITSLCAFIRCKQRHRPETSLPSASNWGVRPDIENSYATIDNIVPLIQGIVDELFPEYNRE